MSSAISQLPGFFQTTGTTVLDELIDYELGGELEDEIDIAKVDVINEELDQDTFDNVDTFGDFKEDELPEFFRQKAQTSDYSELLGSMKTNNNNNVDIKNIVYTTSTTSSVIMNDNKTVENISTTSIPQGAKKVSVSALFGKQVTPAPVSVPTPTPAAPKASFLEKLKGIAATVETSKESNNKQQEDDNKEVAMLEQQHAMLMQQQQHHAMMMQQQHHHAMMMQQQFPRGIPFTIGPNGIPIGPNGVPIPPHMLPRPMHHPNMPPPPHMVMHMPPPHMGMPPPYMGMPGHSVLQNIIPVGNFNLSNQVVPIKSQNQQKSQQSQESSNNSEIQNTKVQMKDAKPKKILRGQMMSPSDVKFVTNKTLLPLQTSDPYADDYYYLQNAIKKNNVLKEEASKNNLSPPEPIFVPLPTWKDAKERLRAQLGETKRIHNEKIRNWEEKEQVLGHTQKSDVTRPKESLSIPSYSDLDQDELDGSGFKAPFCTRLWNMRQAVQSGYDALYSVQELTHLLQTPMVASNPIARAEIYTETDKAVALLSQSLGIRSTVNSSEISLEGGLVAAILQTAKGKKLMSRSLALLPPEQRWALLPVILARIFQSDTSIHTDEDKEVEQILIKTLLEFIQYSQKLQVEQLEQIKKACEENGQPITPAPFTPVLLGHLRQCVKSVMISQMEKNKLRQALTSSRIRAEIMHVIIQVGTKVSEDASTDGAADWTQMSEAFMSMLDD